MFPRLGLLAGALALAGCGGHRSALDPGGPAAGAIAQLWWVMLWGSVGLFALVVGLFALVLLRPGFGARLSPRGWIIAGGLALPVPVLVALLIAGFAQGETLLRAAPGAQPLRVEAVARMWEWEFRYPDHPDMPVGVNLLHIPAGQVVEVVTQSEDVIHSFWVPRLGGKIDATPGRQASVLLLADAPGEFGGVCAEYCGIGHPDMFFEVIAHDPPTFDALAQGGGAP